MTLGDLLVAMVAILACFRLGCGLGDWLERRRQ